MLYYSACLLSFGGGVRWGNTFKEGDHQESLFFRLVSNFLHFSIELNLLVDYNEICKSYTA